MLRDQLHITRNAHPTALSSAGVAAVTLHRVDGDTWRWSPGRRYGYIGVSFGIDDARARVEGATVSGDDDTDNRPVLLRAGSRTRVLWSRGSAATLWLPEVSLRDMGVDLREVDDRPASTVSARAACAYIATFVGMRPRMTKLEELVIERTLVDIAFAVFFSSGEGQVVASNRMTSFSRARMHFDLRFTDADFSVGVASEELNLSARHLERIFEARGTSPSRYLRTRRVELARALIETRAQSGLALSVIAAQSGFASVRSMRRAMDAMTGPPG